MNIDTFTVYRMKFDYNLKITGFTIFSFKFINIYLKDKILNFASEYENYELVIRIFRKLFEANEAI